MSTTDELTDIPALTSGGALFAMAGASEGTTQWKAGQFQLINWGGFVGATTITFHPGATLISGASGTGKSTLLDAYTALMMPSSVPFNGASNGGTGRARGAEQRSLISYLRGQTDTTADEEGQQKAKVLRGQSSATWGAVAMTFVSDTGATFTAARLYYVPQNARTDGQVQQRMLTIDGPLPLAQFEGYAAAGFPPLGLREFGKDLTKHDTYDSFASRLYQRLGIGAGGDGDKALLLLSRVQAGHQISTVDDLYKQMVLDKPVTYAKADSALAHFDVLADTYARMRAEHEREQILAPITDAHERLVEAQASLLQLDTFGDRTPEAASTFSLWAYTHEGDLIEDAISANRRLEPDLRQAARAAKVQYEAADAAYDTARGAYLRAGGDAISTIDGRIAAAEQAQADAAGAAADLASKVVTVLAGRDLTDRATFSTLTAEAADFEQHLPATRERLRRERDELNVPLSAAYTEQGDLRRELTSLAARSTRIPRRLEELRTAVAQHTGFDPATLPFIAELVDVHPDQESWRTAVETTLGPVARLMLVPAARFEAFSRAIDDLALRSQLRFKAAAVNLTIPRPAPGNTVAGKLVLKDDSPFAGWLADFLASDGRNARCVERASDFSGPAFQVSKSGQTRRGTSGTHGRDDSRPILGFTNADTKAHVERQLAELDTQVAALEGRKRALDVQEAQLTEREKAYARLDSVGFAAVDVHGLGAQVAALRAEREALLTARDDLATMADRVAQLKDDRELASNRAHEADGRLAELNREWGQLVTRKDAAVGKTTMLVNRGFATLSQTQAAALDAHLAAVVDDDDASLERWPNHLAQLRRRLNERAGTAQREEAKASAELTEAFARYQDRFFDPNLGTSVQSYEDYAAILADIRAQGLADKRAQWRESLMKWTGQDLVPLARAMASAVEDIEDRLGPVNDILRKLTFGAGDDRLHIHLRRITRDVVRDFRTQLNALSSGATVDPDEHAMEARFVALEAFMAQLRSTDDERYDPKRSARDDLLDVRRHVHICAERRDTTGTVLSTYTSLGSKSGGESQELIAFIVGAALRFSLGDEDRARPRFAPVFLDEGFIKADAGVARRAVQAWERLGFQLIVGAPLDKVAALEPHMDSFLLVTKNLVRQRSRVRAISDAERAAARRTGLVGLS